MVNIAHEKRTLILQLLKNEILSTQCKKKHLAYPVMVSLVK